MTPTLSVCCATAEPAESVRALLAPFREVADEIVVAVDERVPVEELGSDGAVADVLFRFEFRDPVERVFPWLHARCSGDWIFRIDGDEVASLELVRSLPTLISAPDVVQYWFPRRWSFPDPAHWLFEWPWWPDYQNRLVRNDPLLHVVGLSHSANRPELPVRYEDAPLYHLTTALTSESERRAKVRMYAAISVALRERAAERLMAAFYLPEEYASRPPVPAPDEDREAIAAVLGAVPERSAARLQPRRVAGSEIDRYWPPRALQESDYRASIELVDHCRLLAAGEQRTLHVSVRNDGHDTWPGGADRQPLIRLAHCWRHRDGRPAGESRRCAFPSPVAPGMAVIVPMTVTAPERPAEYVLELDVVHEPVRAFGSTTEVTMTIRPRKK
jgi:hypothetical protein